MKIGTKFTKGTEVIEFIGEQDVKGFGFFRHLKGVYAPSFFGLKLNQMKRRGWVKVG
jgi:hypothetical protein